MHGRVGSVFDKGRASDPIEVTAPGFEAGYKTPACPASQDGAGPPPEPSEPHAPLVGDLDRHTEVGPDAATLHRLTGDGHCVHFDPSTATAMDLDGPILHGLATMGTTARATATAGLSAARVRCCCLLCLRCGLRTRGRDRSRRWARGQCAAGWVPRCPTGSTGSPLQREPWATLRVIAGLEDPQASDHQGGRTL